MKLPRAIFVLFVFTGCTKFQSGDTSSAYLNSLMGTGSPDLTPSSDQMSSSCVTDSKFDSCIVFKNPVVQKQGTLTTNEITAQFGVRLRNLLPARGLQNSTISIDTIKTRRLDPFAYSLKPQWNENSSDVEQLTTYYWLDRFSSYLKPRLGSLAITGKNIRVIVDDAFNGWSRKYNSISLKRKSGEFPAALQGELAIYLLAQAEVDFATNGQMEITSTDVLHNTCALDPHGCCKTQIGCSKALQSAAGDYFAAVLFPDRPRVGETLSQNLQGQSVCGLKRDLALLSQTTAMQAYQACQNQNRAGDVYLEGAFYASIWWEIRGLAAGQWSDGAEIVDRLFHKHLEQWVASDTFATAKAKAQSISQSFEGGRLNLLIDNVFSSRGL
jgi:hypothetical protein